MPINARLSLFATLAAIGCGEGDACHQFEGSILLVAVKAAQRHNVPMHGVRRLLHQRAGLRRVGAAHDRAGLG